jgi:hypothetical protein
MDKAVVSRADEGGSMRLGLLAAVAVAAFALGFRVTMRRAR